MKVPSDTSRPLGFFRPRLTNPQSFALKQHSVRVENRSLNNAQIVPQPAAIQNHHGEFELKDRTLIVADASLLRQARLLQNALETPTGYHLPIASRATERRIELRLSRSPTRLGAEGYELSISSRKILIRATSPAGAFYGIQSLLLLMPSEIFRRAKVANTSWRLACIAIEDAPRFIWRGLLIDVARHFLPKEFIFKMLDLMGLYKLNVLQLHLSDDQGWRIEIKRYPRLTEIGARSDYSAMQRPDEAARSRNQPRGGFYTQDDIREIVRYAADRFITVVPEIEMPAHAGAAILAYPELGKEGVFNVEDSTIRVLKTVVDEVLELFPSKFVHIGGDELPETAWKSDPHAQQRMRTLGLRTESQLQSWFIKQFDSYLTAKGRRLVGWDDIIEGGLAPGATVMSWRGFAGGIAAAKAGHNVVMAPAEKTYFDTYQSRLQPLEPQAMRGYLPLEEVYTFEPIAPALSASEGKRVLGAQASLWGEHISVPKHVEYMAFPRLLAFAEAVWSTPRSRKWGSFINRLGAQLRKLDILDVNYRPYRPDPAPVACWTPGLAGSRWVVREWDITAAVKIPGQYKAIFVDNVGCFEVQWIAIVQNGRPIQKIANKGSLCNKREKVFGITVVPMPGAIYKLRARVRAPRGAKASGSIYIVSQSI